MTVYFQNLDLASALIVLFIFFGLLSIYFYFQGIKQKSEEKWSARLGKLHGNVQFENVPEKSPRFDWLLKKMLKKPAIQSGLKKHFLRPELVDRRKVNSSLAAYDQVLTSAGFDAENHRLLYLGGKITAVIMGAASFLGLSQHDQIPETTLPIFLLLLCLFLIVSSLVPDLIVRKIAQNRRNHIEHMAPDIIDLLLLSIETGMTFDHALVEARQILSFYEKILAREMEQLSADLVILPERSEAFENLVKRTGSETLRYLSVALSQGEKYGTPIATSLRNVAQDARKRDLIEIDRRAGRLPVILSVPLMLLILPPVVAISAGPGFVILMRSFGGAG